MLVVTLIDIVRNTLLITGLVMVMMMVIEYVNVASHGKRLKRLENTTFGQVVFAALVGMVPGCIGGFAIVSLFTHRILNLGALVAAMITVTGDEAFVMYAAIPETALILNLILFAFAILVGLTVNFFVKKFPAPFVPGHFAIHHEDAHCHGSSNGSWRYNLSHLSFQRAILIVGILLFIFGLVSGLLDHSHEHEVTALAAHGEQCTHVCEQHAHHEYEHHVHDMGFLFNERWLNLLFVGVALIALFIIAKVNEHFLSEHLWGHVIKKHFLKIFLWTLGALLIIFLLMRNVDIQDWVSDNPHYMLLLALLIGLIPESGPHMIFITLFASGNIPFSILLANSIVQEGHAGLPLLAESKLGFVWVKVLKLLLGLIAGFAGYLIGF